MKEQDAAHSFDEALEDYKNKSIIDFLCGAVSYDGYWWGDKPNDKRPPFWWRSKLREEFELKEAELVRLRSELQRKDAVIKELVPLAQENAEGCCSISESYTRKAQAIVERAKESLKAKLNN